jgi:Protein of unknown function (DUF3551)
MARAFWLLAVVIAVSFAREPARADEAPWCVVGNQGYWDCQYHSIEDCVRHAGRGFCTQNPRYHGGEQPRGRRQPSSRQRR